MKKIHVFILLLFSIAIHCEEEIPLSEGYIGILFSNYKGDAFYRVLMDDNENPYIPLRKMMIEWFGFYSVTSSDGNIPTKLIFYLNPGHHEYWIDPSHHIISAEGKTTNIDNGSVYISENEVWLRYDILAKWLPMEVDWNLNDYALRIYPGYKSMKTLKEERRLRKDLSLQKKKRQDFLKKTPAIQPSYGSFSSRTTIIQNYKHDKYSELNSSSIVSEVFLDTRPGNIYLSYDRDYAKGHKENAMDDIQHITFKANDFPGLSEFTLGDKYTSPGRILEQSVKIRGVGIKRLRKDLFDINLNFKRPFPRDTEIDVYRNGIFLKTYKMKKQGYPDFSDISTKSGDVFLWRIYYPDGDQKEIKTIVPQDNGYLVPEGKVDISAILGSNERNYITRKHIESYDLRYSFYKNFTAGATYNKVIGIDDSVYDIPGFSIGGFPWFNTFFILDAMKINENNVYEINANTILSRKQKISIRKRITKGDNVIPNISGYKPYKEINEIKYHSEFFGGQYDFKFEKFDILEKIKHEYTKVLYLPLLGAFRAKTSYTNDLKNDNSFTWGIDKRFLNNVMEFSKRVSGNSKAIHFHISQKKRRLNQLTYDSSSSDTSKQTQIELQFNKNKILWSNKKNSGITDKQLSFEIAPFNPSISITGTYDPDDSNYEIGLKFTAYLGIATKNAPVKYSQFKTGTISGQVYQIIENKRVPVPGAVVIIGGRKTKCDENGYYSLGDVDTGSKIILTTDGESYYSYLAPEKPVQVIKLREGTNLKVDIKLVETGGMDGFVVPDPGLDLDLMNMRIRVVDELGSYVGKPMKLDEEGFFVIEKLRIGIPYTLELININNKVIAKHKVIINNEDNWISEYKYTVSKK